MSRMGWDTDTVSVVFFPWLYWKTGKISIGLHWESSFTTKVPTVRLLWMQFVDSLAGI